MEDDEESENEDEGPLELEMDPSELVVVNLPADVEISTPNPSPDAENDESLQSCLNKSNYSKWVTAYDDDGNITVTYDLKRPMTLHGMAMTTGNDYPARSPGKWVVKIQRAPGAPKSEHVNDDDEYEFEFEHKFEGNYEWGNFVFPVRAEGTKVTIIFSNDFEHFDEEGAQVWAWEEGLKLFQLSRLDLCI